MIWSYLKESLVQEALPLSTAKHYVKKGKENIEQLDPEVKKLYDNIFGSKNRIQVGSVDMGSSESIDTMKKEFEKIHAFINKSSIANDMDISYDPYDGANITIKFKSPELKKDFAQANIDHDIYSLKTVMKRLKKYISKEEFPKLIDTYSKFMTMRSSLASNVKSPIILSRHPYDVAGMSTSRRWDSCKNAIDGCNRRFLDNEVGNLLISYLMNPEQRGKDALSDPLGRVLILPVREEATNKLGLYITNRIYGAGRDTDFIPQLKTFLSNFTNVYDDSHKYPLVAVGNYYVGDTKVIGQHGELSDTDVEDIINDILPTLYEFLPDDEESKIREVLKLKINDEYDANPNTHRDDFIDSFGDWTPGVLDLIEVYALNNNMEPNDVPWEPFLHYPITGFGHEDLGDEYMAFLKFLKKNKISIDDYK